MTNQLNLFISYEILQSLSKIHSYKFTMGCFCWPMAGDGAQWQASMGLRDDHLHDIGEAQEG